MARTLIFGDVHGCADELEELAQAGGVVDGVIVGTNKGGMSVDVGVRAFMPMSQIDGTFGRDHGGFVVTDIAMISIRRTPIDAL